jgi:alkanesulfonate monooxygenase SsuD/methylene tetrahydromethanopterin reductase-like flavin-dependent oxidoreductase (luciferase family)
LRTLASSRRLRKSRRGGSFAGKAVFESAWNWDHFYPLSGDLDGPNLEGWTTLAALAQATRRIRVGCQVTGMIYRHPAVLANMAATVDIISNGRLELGVGAGWNQQECDAYGIRLPPLRERFDRFDKGVEAMIGLLRDPVTTVKGNCVTRRPPKDTRRALRRGRPRPAEITCSVNVRIDGDVPVEQALEAALE